MLNMSASERLPILRGIRERRANTYQQAKAHCSESGLIDFVNELNKKDSVMRLTTFKGNADYHIYPDPLHRIRIIMDSEGTAQIIGSRRKKSRVTITKAEWTKDPGIIQRKYTEVSKNPSFEPFVGY